MRKLAFIAAAVIISGSVALAQPIDVNNPSFELSADGSQIKCHTDIGDTPDTGVLGWSSPPGSSGSACVDVNCGIQGICAPPTGCLDWCIFPDGNAVCSIDNGVQIYQLLDHNIAYGYRYDLYFDGMVRAGASHDTIRTHLYYLNDPCWPDVNHIDLSVKDIKVAGYERPNGKDDWTYDCHLVFVAESGQAYIGEKLGIKFVSPAQGDLIWVDNVRLNWQWASQAYYPKPEDGATEVPKDANLISWSPGLWAKDVNGHDVYFGSTWAEVNSATTASVEFKGVQSANDFGPGALDLGETYYWRIDEVNENWISGPVPPVNNRWKGDVWNFTVEGRARNPHPVDGANDAPKNVILRWTRGAESLYHDVYFGSTDAEVTSATTGSGEYKTQLNKGTEEYDAGTNESPQVGEQCFWRIDEVNYMTVKGNTWDFTVANYMLVDDFDFYANHNVQRNVWHDWFSGAAGNGEVWINKDANFAVDGNSMRFDYWNTTSPYYSEAKRTYSSGQDWSYAGAGVTLLEIDWFGDMNSVADPPMYVKLSDGSVTVQVNPGPNDVTDESQHTWQIPLSDFNDYGVTLSSITAITLGIGDKKAEGGPPLENGTLYFDDIRLYPPRCYPEHGPAADFTDDCRVDVNDLRFVVRDWCRSGHWGQVVPVIEYLFEEGSGTTVANTGAFGSDYDLTIGLDDEGAPEPNNDPCWYSDADPCRGWTLYFDGELGLHPGADANGGDYLIIPPLNLNSNTVTITAWVRPDDPQDDSFTGLVQHGKAGDEGVAGLYLWMGGHFVYDGSMGYIWNDNSQNTWAWESDIYIPEQQWSMVALVVEPTRATLYLYDTNGTPSDPCDDVLEQATNTLAHNKEEFDGKTFIAGDAYGSSSRFFGGHMDAVRIYNHSLSQDQILDVADDIPVSGIMYSPLSSDADLCVGNKSPTDPNAPIDDQIDFCDWSKFADEWLETKLWPEP